MLDSALAEGQLSMDEHRQRVGAATNAATLGELQALVSDLQTANAPVQSPASGRCPQPKLKSEKRIAADGIAANTDAPPTQLQSAYGLTGLLEQTRKKFGDTMGSRWVTA